MKAIIKTFSTQDCEKIFNGENDRYCIHKPAPKIEPPNDDICIEGIRRYAEEREKEE